MAIFTGKKNDETEIGFGTKNYTNSVRFLNNDGSVNVRRRGLGGLKHLDLFHWLITLSIQRFAILIVLFYTGVNIFFGAAYFLIGPENFGGLQHTIGFEAFVDLVYFSAQTITTVGYGHVHPISHTASIVASAESFIGLMLFAIITGVVFGRFSRPKSELIYSKNILISPYKDIKGVMFRIANTKQYELIENEARVIITMNNPTTNKREFFNLDLEISRINFLPLSWTIVHPIDEKSPFFGLTKADLQQRDAEVIILIKGINDTFSQTVYSRSSYKAASFVENAKFVPVKQESLGDGKVVISVNDIHLYQPI